MDTARVTSKGQLLVPARLRRKYGIKAGTKIRFMERDNEIVLQPLTRDYIRGVCGLLKSSTSATHELLRERARDRRCQKRRLGRPTPGAPTGGIHLTRVSALRSPLSQRRGRLQCLPASTSPPSAPEHRQHPLLRVGREVDQLIGVPFNLEVEAPTACGPSLPEVAGLVVLLGPEGRVAENLEQEGDAAVNRAGSREAQSSSCSGIVGCRRRASTLLELSGLMVERPNKGLGRAEGAVYAALLDILEPLGEPLLNECAVDRHLGSEGDPLALDGGLQEIAHVDADLLPDCSRKRHLKLLFDLDERHVEFLQRQ
jgi:AbrB family looped-hinge helix DNA binding protein